MAYLHLLDMLTCCMGAVLLLWLVSNAANQDSKGISPGTVITFQVLESSPIKGTIGVRVRTKEGGLCWAGDSSPLNPPIIIDPSEEGESKEVKVILTGEYEDDDVLYLFVHALEGGEVWKDPSSKMLVEVSGLPRQELSLTKLFHCYKLVDFRKKP